MNAPNPIDKHVGSRLRMRRLVLDLSQTDIADALGLTFQQVQKYEKGFNRISASRLQHLSQILQVSVPFFFEGAPAVYGIWPSAGQMAEASSPSYVADFIATSDGLSLVKAFMSIETQNCVALSCGLSKRSCQRRFEVSAPTRAAPQFALAGSMR
jgi:transcriptional regulator with XRE-family HTH domain